MDPVDRRQFLVHSAASVTASFVLPSLLLAQGSGDQDRIAAELLKPATQQSIDRGLAWLGGRQVEDGSFKSSGFGRNAAVVALSGMAFLAGGHTPGRGTERQGLATIVPVLRIRRRIVRATRNASNIASTPA